MSLKSITKVGYSVWEFLLEEPTHDASKFFETDPQIWKMWKVKNGWETVATISSVTQPK